MKVQITKLRDNAILPKYQTEHSAAMDLHAAIDEPVTLQPMDRQLIPTGVSIALPDGYESQIRARSGLALKHGITMANGVGTIDADYRGEYGVIAINLGKEPYTIQPGERIAQLVISKYEKVEWEELDRLDETKRGNGAFGSTGKHG
jgi:dUTP pyrophosphatase